MTLDVAGRVVLLKDGAGAVVARTRGPAWSDRSA